MFLFWCRGPVAASHILPPSEKAYQKKSFPLTARSRWAFSKTHNSSSQRNNLALSEDSFKVVQRTSGLGLVSMQAQETMRFSWLRYFHDGIKHLCLFSIFFQKRENLWFREFAFFGTTPLTLFSSLKYSAAFLDTHQPCRSHYHLSEMRCLPLPGQPVPGGALRPQIQERAAFSLG